MFINCNFVETSLSQIFVMNNGYKLYKLKKIIKERRKKKKKSRKHFNTVK